MKYEVTFSMCHCESTIVQLDKEDVQNLSDIEIKNLIEEIARIQIERECPMSSIEKMIETQVIEED